MRHYVIITTFTPCDPAYAKHVIAYYIDAENKHTAESTLYSYLDKDDGWMKGKMYSKNRLYKVTKMETHFVKKSMTANDCREALGMFYSNGYEDGFRDISYRSFFADTHFIDSAKNRHEYVVLLVNARTHDEARERADRWVTKNLKRYYEDEWNIMTGDREDVIEEVMQKLPDYEKYGNKTAFVVKDLGYCYAKKDLRP